MKSMTNNSKNKYITNAVVYFFSTIAFAYFHFLAPSSQKLYSTFPLLGFLILFLMWISGVMFLFSSALIFQKIDDKQKDNSSDSKIN